MSTLTKTEIREIQKYVEKYYTKYLDVQCEVMDHIASIVEEERVTNPDATFRQALNTALKKLPSYEFDNIIREKEEALNKYWNKRFAAYLKGFATWPKFLVLVLLSLIIFIVLGFDDVICFGLIFSILILNLIAAFAQGYFEFPNFEKETARFLSIKSYNKIKSSTLLGYIMFIFQLSSLLEWNYFQHFHGKALLAIALSLLVLGVYSLTWHFPKLIKEEIFDKYDGYLLATI